MAPKGIELASAFVSLSVSAEGIPKQVDRAFRGIKDIEVDVDANTTGATANVKRWRSTEERDPLNIKVDVDTRAATRQVGGLRRSIEDLGRSDALRLNIGAAGIAGLPALASGLGEVAAAMQQVSQAALAVPGGIAGVVSSVGTLAFGLTGVTDAYDAMNKAADDSAKSAGGLAAQQRAEMSASFGLRNAIMDQADARKDVNRAIRDTQRDLQDLNLEMRGGVISEKRALLELEKAKQRLATGDFSDYREALLDVDDAYLRLDESRVRNARTAQELNEATVKGIANSDQVVAANERLIRSEQGVVQAQGAVAAAAPGVSAAQQTAALQMSKLSANGQDFVDALMDVQGPVQTLRNLVQDNIFRGMDDELRGLAGKSMPMLEKGLGGLGNAWNNTFKEVFRVAGEDQTQGILGRIFGNTEEAQNILTGAIDPLAEGLGVLTEAGTRALPRLADGFVTVSERLSNFITQADESGKLDEWIGEGITALGQLGEVALNVGKMFTGITNAANGDLLSKLAEWTNDWQTWLNSTEGQATITDIFDDGRRIFAEWRPILEDLPGLFKGIYDGANQWIGAVTTVVAPVTEFLKQHPALVKSAAEAYLVFKSTQFLGSSFGGLLTMFGTTLPTAAGAGGDKAAKGFSSKFDSVIKGFGWLAAGAYISSEIEKGFDSIFGANTTEVGMPGTMKWFWNLANDPTNTLRTSFPGLFGGGPAQSSNGVLPNAPGQVNGQGPATVGGIPIPGLQMPNSPGVEPFAGGRFQPGSLGGPAGAQRERMGLAPAASASKGPEDRLQVNTIGIKRAIETNFPEVETIGGYREDALRWHPNGLAIDVMIPGAGGLNDPTPPEGLALGNRIYDYVMSNKDVFGVDYVLWQKKDHFNHLHINTTGGGYPQQGTYDDGGWLMPGQTLATNATGKPEYILNPQDLEFLKNQGIDPTSLGASSVDPGTTAHGTGGGMAPGPKSVPGVPARTEGYIPAAAGNTAPVGQGGISSFLDLGESLVHNLIDTGAQAASMAASAAAGAASGGAGAAAGPAASTAIQMGAEAAKRGVSWLYDLGGIWSEAFVEQAMPFGAPRWLGSADPMAFMPQGIPGGGKKAPGTMGAAKTAIQSWAQPGNPALATGTASQGGQAALAADPGTGPQTPPPGQAPNPMDPNAWLQFSGIFDNGGVLQPNSIGVNLSSRPEAVFTGQQFRDMAKAASSWETSKPSTGHSPTYNITVADFDTAMRELKKKERRQARQYSGRP